MAKAPKKQPTWAIIRIKSTPAVEIGRVEAPDAEAAIKKAIEAFAIRNPQHQARLAARRVSS